MSSASCSRRNVLAGLCLAAGLGACTFVFPGNFSWPGAPCRMMSSWCVVDVPSVGSLGYGAGNSGQLDHTMLSFRLAPRVGVTATWSAAGITLVDVDTGKSMRVEALDTKPVSGRAGDYIAEENFVLYGPYSRAEVRLEPRISRLEIRLPPIFSNGRLVEVPPVRMDDGRRMPRPVFIFGGH